MAEGLPDSAMCGFLLAERSTLLMAQGEGQTAEDPVEGWKRELEGSGKGNLRSRVVLNLKMVGSEPEERAAIVPRRKHFKAGASSFFGSSNGVRAHLVAAMTAGASAWVFRHDVEVDSKRR